jgi:hypothetical protein
MGCVRRLVGTAALVLALASCETVAPVSPGPVPDVRGTWTGTWAGAPMTLVIREQEDGGPGGGLHVGSWQVLGRTGPTVAGVMTFTLLGSPVSTAVHGRLGDGGGVRLLLEATPSDGRQELVLRLDDGRLAGTGTSSFGWGPQGAVELTRAR